ncbi:SsgA family sporulation/cell division regulator [Streptomyces sp. NPDC048156]|uniref:SsgA family sporulation/cell division regulator n=1 Tax=Streptomyces sp. NPDC048156 TaxID=3365502 RepID=UPI00371065B9
MSVEKDIAMDNANVTEDDFDALLNASSLGAPHVLAETEPIPVEFRRRLAQAAAAHSNASDNDAPGREVASHAQVHRAMSVSTDIEAYAAQQPAGRTSGKSAPLTVLWGSAGSGKSAVLAALIASFAKTQRLLVISPHARMMSAERPRDAMHALLALSASVSGPGLASAMATVCQRADHHRDAQDTARLADFISCTHLDPTRCAGESMASSSPERPWHTARMTELLASGCDPAEPAPGRSHRHQVVQTAVQAVARAWAYRAADTLCVPLRLSSSIDRTADGDTLLAALTQLRRHMGKVGQQSDTSGMPPCAGPAAYLRVHTPRLEWPQRLLLASHLPTLWAPPGAPPTPSADGALQAGTPAGPDAQKPADCGTPTVWAEEDEQGPALHACLQMAFDEEEGATGASFPTRLTYRLRDPYAVEASFHADDDEPVVWVFARDLLIEGLSGSAGEGDVVVWTAEESQEQEQRTYIRLNSPEGTALLSARHEQLKRYLERTQHLCTPGMEHLHAGAALDAFERELGELTCRRFGD